MLTKEFDLSVRGKNFKEAMKILEDLLDKNINNGDALGRYLFNQNYNSQINLEKVNSYIEKFYQSYKKENLNIANFSFKKTPEKINIGFVSPDFRSHPVGYALINVIKYLKIYFFKTLFFEMKKILEKVEKTYFWDFFEK